MPFIAWKHEERNRHLVNILKTLCTLWYTIVAGSQNLGGQVVIRRAGGAFYSATFPPSLSSRFFFVFFASENE